MKKLIALLVVLAMVFAVAGCGMVTETETKTEVTTEVIEPEAEQVSLKDALQNTIKALETGNLTITVEGGAEVTEKSVPGLVSGYYSPISAQLQVMFDADSKDLTVYGKVMDMYEIQTILIYDGWSVSEGYYGDGWYKEDISEDLESLFAGTETNDLGELLEQVAGDDLSYIEEIVDLEKLVELLESFVTEKFSDEQWLKDTFGYTVTTENGVTVHTFNLDIVELITTLFEHVEEAFVDPEDFEDLMDMIEDTLGDLEDLEIKFKLIQTGNMITGIALEFEGEVDGEYGDAKLTVTFSEIGTTTIDTEMLAEIIEELPDYDEYYDEYYGDDVGYETDIFEDIVYEDVTKEPAV